MSFEQAKHKYHKRGTIYIFIVICSIVNSFWKVVNKSVKPIFHCDAKSFTLGTFASPNAKDSTFALPNARNTNMLVSFALSLYSTERQNTWRRGLAFGNAPNARTLRWRYQHVGIFWRYLTFALGVVALGMYISGVSISFAFGSQRKHSFQWNMDFTKYQMNNSYLLHQ